MVRTTVRVVATPTPCAPPVTLSPSRQARAADEQAEHAGLDQAGDEILQFQRVKAVMDIHRGA